MITPFELKLFHIESSYHQTKLQTAAQARNWQIRRIKGAIGVFRETLGTDNVLESLYERTIQKVKDDYENFKKEYEESS